MFDGVARRYDLTNTVLSFGQDRRWRERTRQCLELRPGERVLDLAAGTGVSTAELRPQRGATRSPATSRSACCGPAGRRAAPQRVPFVAGDAHAPALRRRRVRRGDDLASACATSPTCRRALREMARVVRPGRPAGGLRVQPADVRRRSAFVYLNYLMRALPWIARRVSSQPGRLRLPRRVDPGLAARRTSWPRTIADAGWDERALPQPDRRHRRAAHGRTAGGGVASAYPYPGQARWRASPSVPRDGRRREDDMTWTTTTSTTRRRSTPTAVPTAARDAGGATRTAAPTAARTRRRCDGGDGGADAGWRRRRRRRRPVTAAPTVAPAAVATAVPTVGGRPPAGADGEPTLIVTDLATTARAVRRCARCIACAVDEFAAEHWGTRAAADPRRRARPATSTDLLDAAAVDELVSRRGLRTPFLRMAKDGTVLPPARFTRGGGAGAGIADQAADDRVLAQLADGATLVLQGLHRTWPPLVDFGSRLADELGHPVQINAYITPPQNHGFAPHYDVHDVFVLQVVRPQALAHPRAGGRRPAGQPDVGERAARGGRGAGRGRAADRHRARAGRRALPAARHDPRRRGARRDVDPPHRRRPPGHPLPAGAAPARRSPRTTRRCAPRCRWASTSATRRCSPPHLAATVEALRDCLDAAPADGHRRAGVGRP